MQVHCCCIMVVVANIYHSPSSDWMLAPKCEKVVSVLATIYEQPWFAKIFSTSPTWCYFSGKQWKHQANQLQQNIGFTNVLWCELVGVNCLVRS